MADIITDAERAFNNADAAAVYIERKEKVYDNVEADPQSSH